MYISSSRRLRIILPAVLTLAACRLGQRKIAGEVRGMSPAITAYTRVLSLSRDTLAAAITTFCDSVRIEADTTPPALAKVLADQRAKDAAECEALGKTQPGTAFSCLMDVNLSYEALKEGPDSDFPDTFLEQAVELKQRAVKRQAAMRAQLFAAKASRDSLLQTSLTDRIRLASDSLGVLEAGGGFAVGAPGRSSAVVLLVDAPGQLGLTRSLEPAPQIVLAYDSATFSLIHLCRDRSASVRQAGSPSASGTDRRDLARPQSNER